MPAAARRRCGGSGSTAGAVRCGRQFRERDGACRPARHAEQGAEQRSAGRLVQSGEWRHVPRRHPVCGSPFAQGGVGGEATLPRGRGRGRGRTSSGSASGGSPLSPTGGPPALPDRRDGAPGRASSSGPPALPPDRATGRASNGGPPALPPDRMTGRASSGGPPALPPDRKDSTLARAPAGGRPPALPPDRKVGTLGRPPVVPPGRRPAVGRRMAALHRRRAGELTAAAATSRSLPSRTRKRRFTRTWIRCMRAMRL